MDISQVGTVLTIVVITYLIGLGAKLVPGIKDNFIPVIVGVAGGALGIVGFSGNRCSECYCSRNCFWSGIYRSASGI